MPSLVSTTRKREIKITDIYNVYCGIYAWYVLQKIFFSKSQKKHNSCLWSTINFLAFLQNLSVSKNILHILWNFRKELIFFIISQVTACDVKTLWFYTYLGQFILHDFERNIPSARIKRYFYRFLYKSFNRVTSELLSLFSATHATRLGRPNQGSLPMQVKTL